MNQVNRILFAFFILIITASSSQAQLVNYEETWQEFLKNPLTSAISKLTKPEKSQPANYIKYSLMYANSYFCADNLSDAENMMKEVASMGVDVQKNVPGFTERLEDLKVKIQAYKDLAPVWERFLKNKSSITRKDLAAVPEAMKVCEKGTLCKMFYMMAHAYYCEGNLVESRDNFDNKVQKLAATTFDPKNVAGLNEEIQLMKKLWAGIDLLNPAWDKYIQSGISPGYTYDLPVFACYTVPNIKACLLRATADFCGQGAEMLKKINELKAMNSQQIPADVADKVQWLENEVNKWNNDIAALNSVWEKFIPNDKVPTGSAYKHLFVCDREAEVKAYLMDGLDDVCVTGQQALDSIARIRKDYKPNLGNVTMTKLTKLQDLVKKEADNVATLNKAWADFIPDDKLSGGIDFVFEYCDKIAQTKSYIIEGTIFICTKGEQRLKDIEKIRAEYTPKLDEATIEKITKLQAGVDKINKDAAELKKAWDYLVANKEVSADLKYEHDFICNREGDVQALLLDGLVNPCLSGAAALAKIETVITTHKPTLSTSTQAQLDRLKNYTQKEANNVAVLNKAWVDFVPDNKLSGEIDFVFEYCDKIAQTKSYIIEGTIFICTKGEQRLKDIETLRAEYTPKLDEATIEKITKLQAGVDKIKKDAVDLKKAWDYLVSNKEVSAELRYEYEFICNREGDVQALLLDGLTNPCLGGAIALAKIEKVMTTYKPTLSPATQEQLDRLKNYTQKEANNVAVLNKAWVDFAPDNKLSGGIDFVFEYCDKIAQTRAYIIDGTVNFCEKAKARLADISKLQESYLLTFDAETKGKFDWLYNEVQKSNQELADLNTAWTLYIKSDTTTSWEGKFPPKDTKIRGQIKLVDFYCDKIAQTKSWVIKGQLDPCDKGEDYLKQIVLLQSTHSLVYDKELTCQIHRLKGKVYQCKYWALVLKAREITHLERETFGPKSAKIMYNDLNPPQKVCETTVVYEPLGFIGIKYTVAPHLCQDVNLAKMGDPLYYKKIATWVDKEVLQKYCEASMRCKEDFFIYLEGHTDGNRFNGRKYDQSLDIPAGTPYTHFIGKTATKADTIQKTTRNITQTLENNMELGIARAWTVKQQLDFMQVPITVGAYEHPAAEKGGEYRRIDIELNLTNLLLDFYEKTLNRLVVESGIGTRPKASCE